MCAKRKKKEPAKKATRKVPQKKLASKKTSPKKAIRRIRKVKTPTPKLSKNSELATLGFLEKTWPSEISDDVKNAFATLRFSLSSDPKTASLPKTSATNETPAKPLQFVKFEISKFDALDLIRRVLMAHDMLFLSRQITYHISASANLPAIWGDRDRIGQSFSKITEHLLKRADRGSKIDITISTFSLRGEQGAKISFESNDHNGGTHIDQKYLDGLLEGRCDDITGISLGECRQTILGQKGQLWIDMPKPHRPIYNIVLPASEAAASRPAEESQTFKYNISIANYANVRKRFGIKKSASLLVQIEHYVKSLVRYPIDMVMSVSDKGIITTIYETQKGAAESVASRISQRLGKEDFRIGKRPVELAFKYELSKLTSEKLADAESYKGS